MDNEARSSQLLWIAIGGAAPIAVAAALVSLRDHMLNANVALVLVLVVVLAAVGGGRSAGAAAAVSAALSFNFFHTVPYLTLEIDSADDVETTLLLLAVGLAVGQLATFRRHPVRARRERRPTRSAGSTVSPRSASPVATPRRTRSWPPRPS